MNNYPDLSKESEIAVDIETYDPGLREKGPGDHRGQGYVLGVSLFTSGGFSHYYPIRHCQGNYEIEPTLSYLKSVLETPHIPKLGANLIYDISWLLTDGIEVNGQFCDVQIVDALIDENQDSFSLDTLSMKYLNIHKNEEALFDFAKHQFGFKKPEDVKGNMHLYPADIVAPYAVGDVENTFNIFQKQKPIIKDFQLEKVFDLECRLTKVLVAMRKRGVRVDIDQAKKAYMQLQEMYDKIYSESFSEYSDLNIHAAESIAQVCDFLKIQYNKTAKDAPSFTASWMAKQEHKFFKDIVEARRIYKVKEEFLLAKTINLSTDGRVYPTYFQTRNHREDGKTGGAASGRMSCKDPNLQQVPSGKSEGLQKELSVLLRKCFIPEDDCEWCTLDFSQQEPRITVHYAATLALNGIVSYCDKEYDLRGGKEALQRYIDNPNTDYHQMVADMAGMKRTPAKALNLGMSYGMGRAKAVRSLLASCENITIKDAEKFYDLYHEKIPYIKGLSSLCMDIVNKRGYIRTILGRRSNFNLYGLRYNEKGKKPLPHDQAVASYGKNVVRYGVFRALNRAVSGSGADMEKMAVVLMYEQHGIIPINLVHDDISINIPKINGIEVIKIAKKVMETAIPLLVPMKVEADKGDSWGNLQPVEAKCIT